MSDLRMSISPEILRLCSKAKLKYDRHWNRDDKLSELLEKIANEERFVALHPSCLPETYKRRRHSSPAYIRNRDDDVATSASHRNSRNSKLPPLKPSTERPGVNYSTNDLITSVGLLVLTCDELNHCVNTEMEIRAYENQQRLKIQEKVGCKRESFGRFLGVLYEKSRLDLRVLRERRRFLDGMRERELEAETEAGQDELKRRHQKLRHDHESFAKMADERLKEASLKDKQEEEEALKRVELRQKIGALAACKQHVSATYQEIVSVVRSCHNLHLVPEDVRSAVQSMNEVVADVQKILDRVRTGKVDDSDLELMRHLETKTNTCLEIITLGVELANKAAEAEKNVSSHGDSPGNPLSPIASTGEAQVANSVTAGILSTNNFGDLERYVAAMTILNNTVDAYKDLATDPNLKAYRATFKMAINAPVNAISAQSVSQVRDKLNRLCAMFNGRQVDLTTGRRFSVDEHPQGRLFFMDLLAKKFIGQAETQVSSSHVAAFPIAIVIVGLWKLFPAFGELLMAHLNVACPYLVPCHLPKSEGQSDIDYHSGLGYKVIDGVLEQQAEFLKRMSGIVRLYAAVIQSPLSKGSDHPHPHGLDCGWRWLACTLSIDPLPDITATVLYDFLEVCGYALQKTYGRQFQKLLSNLCRDYFPRIKAVTTEESGGPTTRLETFLQGCIGRGRIAEPKGILPPNFWMT